MGHPAGQRRSPADRVGPRVWLGLFALAIGTVLGALLVGYLSTMGPRTGAG